MPKNAKTLTSAGTLHHLHAILGFIQASRENAQSLSVKDEIAMSELMDNLGMSELSVLRMIGDEDEELPAGSS